MFYTLRLAAVLNAMLYGTARFRNWRINRKYKRDNPGIVLPADYPLYETYQLHYRKFIEDGQLAAKEITEWTKPYFLTQPGRVLDWGCGVGRVIRHMQPLLPGSGLYGCDINAEMIRWNKAHYHHIDFTTIDHVPPMDYDSLFFDLVYGLSIFTHIEATMQTEWLQELYRLLNKNGILLVTTQGKYYHHKLVPKEKKALYDIGIFTQPYSKKGHRMLSTFHTEEKFRQLAEPYFTVLDYYDGQAHPEKTGGQDLWILQKK